MKNNLNRKLSQNKTILSKKIGGGSTKQLSNLTKYSLNQNTTKLSLGDRTLASNKLSGQSQSTVKKGRVPKNLSNLQIDEHVEQRLNEI